MSEYAKQVLPWAQVAAAGTGLPVLLIVAQWAHETGWGKSVLAGRNNHGGIKFTGQPGSFSAEGGHAGYESMAAFVADYVRVINLSYYAQLRQAAAAGRPLSELVYLFGPYAEDPQYGAKLLRVAGEIGEITAGPAGGSVTVPVPPGLNVPAEKLPSVAKAGLLIAAGLLALAAIGSD